jgi:hypothetical protein
VTPPAAAPWVHAYLAAARIPLRLACVSRSGWPSIVSLWYLPEDGRLWCATPARAHVARLLAREPRCGFEVAENEAPYRGVRGQGRARLEPARGDEVLRKLVRRYLGSEDSPFARWLLSRGEPELAIGIEVERVTSWDFTRRMTAPAGDRI